MLAYSYRRFSSSSQILSDSIRRQTKLAEDWSARSGIKLDKSLNLSDLGISAFKGGNIQDSAALGQFIALVNKGRIAAGSYLLIENLDRLSRQEIKKGLMIFLQLLDKGIKIVQLSPVEKEFNSDSEEFDIMLAIMELSRGHSESAMKSERIGNAWKNKKSLVSSGKILTARLPSWVSIQNGKLVLNSNVKTVRKIFELSSIGYSQVAIVRYLNSELDKYPVFGKSDKWAVSTVSRILTCDSVQGIYQPYRNSDLGRVKDGKPVEGYFPAAVSEELWLKSRASIENRKTVYPNGRNSKHVNLLKGLLFSAETGESLHYHPKEAKSPAAYEFSSLESTQTLSTKRFPAEPLIASVLFCLKEINTNDLISKPDNTASDLELAEGRLSVINGQLDGIAQKIISGQNIDLFIEILTKLEKEKADLAKVIAYLRQKTFNPTVSKIVDTKDLLQQYEALEYAEETLYKLQGCIRSLIKSIHCFFVRKGRKQEAFLIISFKDNEHRRFVHCKYKPAQRGNKARPTDIPVSFVVGFSDKLPPTLEVPSKQVAELLADWPD